MCKPLMKRFSSFAKGGPYLAAALLIILAAGIEAAEQKKPAADSPAAAIHATADAFLKAFNSGDAKAVAALYTTNATSADEQGNILKGRKAIEDEYAALFKVFPGARMEIAIQAIDFPAPGLAVEDGTATVITKTGAPPTASRYTVVHVLQDDKWLMAAVRESNIEIPSNYSRLQALEWLIGKWEVKSDDTVVQFECRWIANKSFIQREYTVRKNGMATTSGMQIVGWDPQSGRIKSWSFDSSGGHGTGMWTALADGWQIDSTGVLADGTATSSREFLIRIPGENDVFGWRSVTRKAGQVALPDMAEIVLDRVTEKK
jgi:uncharacterized protein (TIGR02246 family)